MANAVKARETIQVIRENPERLNMERYVSGAVNPGAFHWSECGTSCCVAGWRCLLDGLRPDCFDDGTANGRFRDANGNQIRPHEYAQRSLELNNAEAEAIFERTGITDVDDLEWIVEAVIARDWAYCGICDGRDGGGCWNCNYRGIIRPSEIGN